MTKEQRVELKRLVHTLINENRQVEQLQDQLLQSQETNKELVEQVKRIAKEAEEIEKHKSDQLSELNTRYMALHSTHNQVMRQIERLAKHFELPSDDNDVRKAKEVANRVEILTNSSNDLFKTWTDISQENNQLKLSIKHLEERLNWQAYERAVSAADNKKRSAFKNENISLIGENTIDSQSQFVYSYIVGDHNESIEQCYQTNITPQQSTTPAKPKTKRLNLY